ncbi:MAG TPA: histidine phosphatase family protein [Thermoanaerobaculia bacterium]|nr:histidine phosphatase family protein [Thermoanaerobaculia bacterium]
MTTEPRYSLRLYLVRHGQVAANREFRYVGDRDDPLTELGRRQAAAVASALGALRHGDGPLRIGRVLSSPRRRARDTALAIGAALGIDVETEGRLAEQSYGGWEGLTRDEVRRLSDEHAGHLAQVDADPAVAPPGGESLLAAQRRVLGLVEELARADDGRPGGVVLVSHVGPIKALVAAALDLPLLNLRRLFLDLATVSVIDWGKPPVLRLFNDHSHLGFERARWLERG